MKKIYLIMNLIGYLSISLLTSCTDETIENVKGNDLVMVASDFEYDGVSRTDFDITENGAEFKWSQNDKIGIFPDEGSQISFSMKSGAGTKSAVFNGGGWALKPSSTYAAYYPLIDKFNLDKTAIPINFDGQMQVGNASTSHLGKYDFMAAWASIPKEGNVIFNFKHLCALVELNIAVPKKGNLTSVTLSSDEEIFTTKGTIDLMTESPKNQIKNDIKSKSITIKIKDLITTVNNEIVKIYAIIAPLNLIGKKISATVVNNNVSYHGTVETKNLEAGTAYKLAIKLEEQESVTTIHVAKAGTLPQLIGDKNKFKISRLKLTGELNGTDIAFIREMIGTGEQGNLLNGKFVLKYLDLYDAITVEGGKRYFYDPYPDDYMFYELFTEYNKISKHMFDGCARLETIILPKSITIIDDYAFHGCKDLKSVNIPETVRKIGKGTFQSCKSFKNIIFPQTLSIIDDIAFEFCDSLVSVDIPKNVTSMGYAFRFCENLETVNLPDKLACIKETSFINCPKLKNIHLPEDLVTIGKDSFSNTNLQLVTIPPKVELIEDGVFSGCKNLSLAISSGMQKLHSNMFEAAYYCKTIILPRSLFLIEKNSLPPHIEDIYCFAEEPPTLDYSIGGLRIYVPKGSIEKYKLSKYWKNHATHIFEMPEGITEP